MEKIKQLIESISKMIFDVDEVQVSPIVQIIAELKSLEAMLINEKNSEEFNPEYVKLVTGTIEYTVKQLNGKQDLELIFKTLSECVSHIQKVFVMSADPRSLSFPFTVNIEGPSRTGADSVIEIDDGIIEEFIEKQNSDLEEMQTLILQFEQSEDKQAAISAIKRLIHTTKGEAGVLNLMDIQCVCHEAETYLENCLNTGCNTEVLVDKLLQVKDWLEQKLVVLANPTSGVEIETSVKLIKRLFLEETKPAPQPQETASNSSEEVVVQEAQSIQPEQQVQDSASVSANASEEVISVSEENNTQQFEDYDTGYDPDPSVSVPLEDEEFIQEFITEAQDHLETVDKTVLLLEENPEDKDALNTIFRAYHTIKGISGMLDLEVVKSVAHSAENILDMARQDRLKISTGIIDIIFESTDKLKLYIEKIQEAMQGERIFYYDKNAKPLINKINLILKGDFVPGESDQPAAKVEAPKPAAPVVPKPAPQAAASAPVAPKPAPAPAPAPKAPPKVEAKDQSSDDDDSQKKKASQAAAIKVKEMIKVDTEVLDKILDTIGELVIAESMVQRDIDSGTMGTERADRNMRQLEKITRELQELGTSLRMTSVKPTFDKMARLVRDVAKKTGKLVTFKIEGEDTELDRNVVERISDPLVHMIRNSVDHGIEPNSEDRVKGGKPLAGTVVLRAFHEGGNVHIQIEDDGRGINKEVIYRKAVEKGLIAEDTRMSEEEVFNLIFAPGFSTAQTITDVSGRGVGMDVVKKNIEALRGRVKIESVLGHGTTFTIMLPLTLAIIDGMIVQVGRENYIIPTLNIRESIKLSKEQFNYAFDQGESVLIRNELIPIYRLSAMFGITESKKSNLFEDGGLIVVVESAGKAIGLVVDEILGQQQIVIKNLGSLFQDLKGFSGGAIMSDGTVGLILDVTTLVSGHSEKDSGRGANHGLVQ